MRPEPLLVPFTDEGKEVSTGIHFWILTLELKTGTGRPIRDQWGSVLRPVPTALDVLHLAT